MMASYKFGKRFPFKQYRTLFSCVFLITVFWPSHTFARCAEFVNELYVVEIKSVFSFKTLKLNSVEILSSLEPKLSYPYPGRKYKKTQRYTIETTGANYRLNSDFCVTIRLKPGERLYFHYGQRRLEAEVRSFEWRSHKSPTGQTVYRATQPTFHFLDQPDPHWIIPLRAALLHNDKGQPLIELRIYNPSLGIKGGVPVQLLATQKICPEPVFVAGLDQRVEIRMRVEQGHLNVFLKDKDFVDFIETEAEWGFGPCNEIILQVYLGRTGAIGARQNYLIHYVFLLDPRSATLDGLLFQRMQYFRLVFFESISGDFVTAYPKQISFRRTKKNR